MPLTMGRDRLPRSSFMLLLLVLFSTNVSNSAEPQYMVLVPYLLHTATPEKVCLLLSHLNETVTLSASLETFGGNRSLFADLVTEKDLFRCVSFTLPRISSSSEVAFFTVQIKGPTQDFRKRKTVLIKNDQSLVFVQTDKPIYKPGQTVKFRIVSVDENFHPLNELIPLVYLENPKRSRIGQWQNLQLESGLKQLAFPLSSEPIQGSYKVVVKRESGGLVEHPFTVEEFVVPKFEVKVQVPKIISIMDKKVKISVCGIYTYGKPVPGLATVRMCRNLLQSFHCKKDFCEEFSQQLNSNGCTTQEVNTNLFHIKSAGYEMELNVEAKIREEGTELEFTGHGTSKITNIVTRLEFVKVESHFRRGIPFSGQVLLVDGNNVPISNKVISISAAAANYFFHATTNEQGLAEFSINTTNILGTQLFITASHEKPSMCISFAWLREEHQTAFHSASQVYSLSGSYVQVEPVDSILPCGQTQTLKAHYTLRGPAIGELKELTFYYLIMAKGGIIRSGTHVLPVEPEDGSFPLSFPVTSDVAPIARLFIFTVLPNGEVIGDSERFEIENCLTNKVDLSFSPAQSLPASHAHLRVTASPQSLCALRAVDQSVLLMKPEAELSPSSVYNLLTTKDLTYFPENLEDQEDKQEYCVYPNVIGQGLYIENDIYSFLKGMGLKVLTNSRVRKPQSCSTPYQPKADGFLALPMSHRGLGGIGGDRGLAGPYILHSAGYNVMHENNIQSPEPVSETVRSYFPETWIWELAVVDSSGVAEVGVTVPDTITEWKAGALCLSNDTGLGLSLPASLRAFQPFFVELTMPYSVIRGEAFTLKATILNYLPKCIRVKVQLEASTAFLAVQNTKGKESYCICVNERQTVSWAITPKTLGNVNFSVSAESVQSLEMCGNELAEVPETGRKDTVIKTLLVEPEGIEQEKTFNSMTCASGTEIPEQLSLKLPENVVKESARASFSVLGDILGSALQNIQNLLRMPYGCGEQNMVLFAPNIYVLNYLNETQQLTSEIKSKAIGYLISGYQRQLNYKHQDGSYSTFGEKSIFGGEEGNTWLTAFVLQTFAQARTHIFIDEAHITKALTWLFQKQKDNGCFRSSGSLFNNAIKGGVEDEVTLSVYITIALRQSALPVTHLVVQKALFCLESAWNAVKEGTQGSHTYTKALLAYAFALMGNQDRRREILNSLDKEAVKEDNSVHWERSQKPRATESYFYQPRAPSAEVEMTSYVLLAYLTAQPAPSSEDLTSASHIVKWITKQQNSYGGFSSTQDTVVALHALSRYGAATFTRSQKTAQVTIRDSQTFSTKLQVDNNNLLLLQQVSLPEVPGEYVITVTGERCVYLQTSMKYNILPEKVDSPFALEVQTLPQTCDGVEAHTSFQISLNVSYRGSRSVSNMVIVDVKMVSGFIPLKPTVKMLEKSSHVSRTEVSINHVIIYVEEVTDKTLNFSFTVVQDIPVRDLKPAIVKVYDYYETDESATAEYIAPCTTGAEEENV